MRTMRNLRRGVSVSVAGLSIVGVAALPAAAATHSPARPATVAHAQPAQSQQKQVRVDLLIQPTSVPAGARAVLVRDVTHNKNLGVYALRSGAVTRVTVTVAVGTTLDVSALTSTDANKPANLGTVRVVVGTTGSTSANNTVTVAFRRGARPVTTLSSELRRLAQVAVR